jgi:hypothetical protein
MNLNRAHARDVARDANPPALCAHAEVPLRSQSVRDALVTVLQVWLTWSGALGRCHAFRPHTLAGGTASYHWASVPPHVAALAHAVPCRDLLYLGVHSFLSSTARLPI